MKRQKQAQCDPDDVLKFILEQFRSQRSRKLRFYVDAAVISMFYLGGWSLVNGLLFWLRGELHGTIQSFNRKKYYSSTH